VDDDPHIEAEETVDGTHPLCIAPREIVVHRDHVSALSCEGIQIHGHGRHQGLSFTGLHLRDLALVEHDTSQELHVEGPHVQGAPGSLADRCKGLGQDVFQARPCVELVLEIRGHCLEVGVTLCPHGIFPCVDRSDKRLKLLELAFVPAAEYLYEPS